MTEEEDDPFFPPYQPIDRTDILVRCQSCGSVVEGNVLGTTMHTVWHTRLDYLLSRRMPQVYK